MAILYATSDELLAMVANLEFVPYHRYTGSTIGKIILPVQPHSKLQYEPIRLNYDLFLRELAEDLSLNYKIIILKLSVPFKS